MENDIRTILVDLPTSVKGFCYMDSTYTPCIVLNARLPHEIQQEAYKHEVKHIENGDMSNTSYHEYMEAI